MRRDPVTPALHRAVLLRDRECILFRLDPTHDCADRWNRWHSARDLDKLTVEHVHDAYGMTGKRAPSDLAHLVAMCWQGNVRVPSKAQRGLIRAYLATLPA